jgi:UDP-glucuronate 4-epimerase
MNVLVTGGAGFIGSHLVEALASRGDRVLVLDNFDRFYQPALKRKNLERALAGGRVALLEGDICEPDAVERAFGELGQVQVVVHLAARAGVRPSIEQPALYARVNVEGTSLLLERARSAGVERFVFASSSSVYGARCDPPFTEEDRVDRPVSPYAATKIAGEMLCATFAHLYGLEAVGLRFFTVFGPRQRPDLAIAKFVRLIRSGQKVSFFGDGSSARDYTFVEDIIRGVMGAMDRAWPRFEVLNLGGSSPTRLSELVSAIERATGRSAILERLPEQPGDVPLTFASVDKAERLLGWKPTVSINQGLERYVHWLDSDEADGWR